MLAAASAMCRFSQAPWSKDPAFSRNARQNQPQTFTCMLVGSFSPFATTKAERERTGDPRPSIEERYHGRDDYLRRIRIAAPDLVARGYLLSDDAAVIVQEAASSNLFAPAPANPAPR